MQQHLPQAKKVQIRIGDQRVWCWQFVRVVTAVTTPLFKHSQTMQTEQETVTPQDEDVTESESKNNGKLSLDKHPVTAVTEAQPIVSCPGCLKPIPEDHLDVTVFEGQYWHIPCFRRLEEGRRENAY